MNLKMREKSLFAVLLRSPWWVSVLIAAAVAAVASALLPAHLVPFGVAGCLPFVVISGMAAWKQRNTLSPERAEQLLSEAAMLPAQAFIAQITTFYERQGYAVSKSGQGSADLQLLKHDQTTLLACKRWKAATHGTEPLRELTAQRDSIKAERCIYISQNSVTAQALVFAKQEGIVLISGAGLAQLLSSKG
jgi:restriction system protein